MHAQVVDYAININEVFPFDLENQMVDGYEGPRAPDTSTDGTETQTFNILTTFKVKFKAYMCVCARAADLQCTTVGECLEYWSMCSLTRCLKLIRSSVVSGTP